MASDHDPESLSSTQKASLPPHVQDPALSQWNGETPQSPRFAQNLNDAESPRHRGQRSSNQSSKDASRWHHTLHPHVRKEGERNPLPKGIAHLMHPTHALLIHTGSELGSEQKWTSRNERKHRFVAVAPTGAQSRSARNSKMEKIEYWNVSWWVAQFFTWGSVVWVINGFASFLPFGDSAHYEPALYCAGWTAFIGATIFEFGSILGMWEAWNREDTAGFGWSIKEALEGAKDETEQSERRVLDDKWVWFSLDRKYFREIGFLAAFFQFWAATIFWISGFTAIPTIQATLAEHPAALNGAFWSPQVVGGSGFIISATFIMLETQEKWWKPNLTSLGWHVGFWNLVGGIGFTLCGALGYAATASHGAAYQSALSTFWGGWAFLIGSLLQWYESVNSVEQ
ncbi:hypothetical protein CPB83DRAFT_934328 [Crepidotus variabilis]|uniref:Integral membrane protein n=1 Tax=Crepidotus variabilis TaxID=179855 RepID=A0A9P6EEF3_9AGAR|nr:hypothetical protein CPB83DRAFT_934328 [Crepidotus variabilis]